MQTIMLFAAKAAAAVGIGSGAAAAGTGAAAAATTAGTAAAGIEATTAGAAAGTAASAGTFASTALSALRIGTTVVSALSVAGQANLEAQALQAEGRQAAIAGAQELVQSTERANQIERDYNDFVNQGLAAASASGIDLGSASVGEARAQARDAADRELAITRNGAALNANLRRSRASYLKDAAKLTRQVGGLGALATAGRGALKFGTVG